MSTENTPPSVNDQERFARDIRRMGWIVVLCLIVWGAGLKLAHQFLEARHHAAVVHPGD
ncbi:MAG: hypothetical protein JSS49_29795 [Planctomycetes bacterium]|nr:hypothetical protein [Planctomycetota bacterium]